MRAIKHIDKLRFFKHQLTVCAQAKWKTYQTRIVSTANKVNLEFNEALKSLEDGLVRSISGIF
jgi:hypothetical protein